MLFGSGLGRWQVVDGDLTVAFPCQMPGLAGPRQYGPRAPQSLVADEPNLGPSTSRSWPSASSLSPSLTAPLFQQSPSRRLCH